MNAPAVVSGSVIMVPVLSLADVGMAEMEMRAIVFGCQIKGNCGRAG